MDGDRRTSSAAGSVRLGRRLAMVAWEPAQPRPEQQKRGGRRDRRPPRVLWHPQRDSNPCCRRERAES